VAPAALEVPDFPVYQKPQHFPATHCCLWGLWGLMARWVQAPPAAHWAPQGLVGPTCRAALPDPQALGPRCSLAAQQARYPQLALEALQVQRGLADPIGPPNLSVPQSRPGPGLPAAQGCHYCQLAPRPRNCPCCQQGPGVLLLPEAPRCLTAHSDQCCPLALDCPCCRQALRGLQLLKALPVQSDRGPPRCPGVQEPQRCQRGRWPQHCLGFRENLTPHWAPRDPERHWSRWPPCLLWPQ